MWDICFCFSLRSCLEFKFQRLQLCWLKDKSLDVEWGQQTSDLSLSMKEKLVQVKNFLRLKTTDSVFHFMKMHNINSAELVAKTSKIIIHS